MRHNPKEIYDYLISKEVGHVHALGMLANIEGESSFDDSAQEVAPLAGKGGFGLFQHTGPRRRALFKRFDNRVPTWQEQIDFALEEPDTERYLSHHFETAAEATEWFVRHWERPANPDRDVKRRLSFIAHIEQQIA